MNVKSIIICELSAIKCFKAVEHDLEKVSRAANSRDRRPGRKKICKSEKDWANEAMIEEWI